MKPTPHSADAVFEHRQPLSVSAEVAFAWHQRPGAFERLLPPWDGSEVLSAPAGLDPGSKAILRVRLGPLSRRWIAEHVACEPGLRFRDVQRSGPFALWDHSHEFLPDGPDACVLVDRIRYALPLGVLGKSVAGAMTRRRLAATFGYRGRVLTHDLARHDAFARSSSSPSILTESRPMKILVSGANGLVGRALVPFLTTGGHEVIRLVRREARSPDEAQWDPQGVMIDADRAEGADAVVHLAGAGIADGRWTKRRKALIKGSRVEGTRRLSEALARLKNPPKTLVSASAIGFYGDRGDTVVDETAEPGTDFLADVVRGWESACYPARRAGLRVVNLRFGVILSPAGGALKRMLLPFKLGLGGPLGDGKQLMSWVALDDVLGAILHALATPSLEGPVNVVAPEPATNATFTRALGAALNRPTVLPMPAFAARLAFGEMADALLLASTGVAPQRLLESGYEFAWPVLEKALAHQLGR